MVFGVLRLEVIQHSDLLEVGRIAWLLENSLVFKKPKRQMSYSGS